jgi:hypothetical protein
MKLYLYTSFFCLCLLLAACGSESVVSSWTNVETQIVRRETLNPLPPADSAQVSEVFLRLSFPVGELIKLRSGPFPFGSFAVFNDKVSSISITSQQAYNDTLAAGALLNGIISAAISPQDAFVPLDTLVARRVFLQDDQLLLAFAHPPAQGRLFDLRIKVDLQPRRTLTDSLSIRLLNR